MRPAVRFVYPACAEVALAFFFQHVMLASLQKLITLTLAAAALGFLFYFWRSTPVLALTGFVMISFGHTFFLAIEFMALRHVNQNDPTPQATGTELLHAWIGETLAAPQVFCWRQPFRAEAFPDYLPLHTGGAARRGVVFVHGFFCNRGFWNPWLKRLQGQGHAFVALNLEPLFGSIDDHVPQIDEAVQRITQATGLPPLLVCHSMGGLAVRAWLKSMRSEHRVHHVVTIGTPHRGTWLARFGHGRNGQQMRLLSDWHAQLDQDMPTNRPALFTCWYSNCDNIVFPTSTATLPGADNRLIRAAAHVQLAFVPEVVTATLAMID